MPVIRINALHAPHLCFQHFPRGTQALLKRLSWVLVRDRHPCHTLSLPSAISVLTGYTYMAWSIVIEYTSRPPPLSHLTSRPPPPGDQSISEFPPALFPRSQTSSVPLPKTCISFAFLTNRRQSTPCNDFGGIPVPAGKVLGVALRHPVRCRSDVLTRGPKVILRVLHERFGRTPN